MSDITCKMQRTSQFCSRTSSQRGNHSNNRLSHQGIKKQGKGLQDFSSDIALSAAILIFSNTRVVHRVRLLRCFHAEAYLDASISVPCATDRSIGLPELRHCKRHFQTDPDVKFRKPDCCCAAPGGQKHVELRKTGVNEGSLSGAWSHHLEGTLDLTLAVSVQETQIIKNPKQIYANL